MNSSNSTMTEQLGLSLFICAGLGCAGLPTVIWALYQLRHYQNTGIAVPAFIVSLILSDTVELLLSPFLVTLLAHSPNLTLEMLCLDSPPCWLLLSGFAEARLCGLHFHQLVVLEGITSLIYPPSAPPHPIDFFFPLMLSLGIFLTVVISNLFSTGYKFNLIFCVVPIILTLITIGLAITNSCSSNGPLRRRCPGVTVLGLALFTLVLYMPCLVLSFRNYPDPFYVSAWVPAVVSIMGLRVVTEPLLCVLVCRETLVAPALQRLSTSSVEE